MGPMWELDNNIKVDLNEIRCKIRIWIQLYVIVPSLPICIHDMELTKLHGRF